MFDEAFQSVRLNDDVLKRDRHQPEFETQIWDYLDKAVSDERVSLGKAALNRHRSKFSAIEARYGVDKEVVAAIWGVETAFGKIRGDIPTIVRAVQSSAA